MHWVLLFVVLGLSLDLGAVRNEPNLEKRSVLALDYSNSALDAARDADNAGEDVKFAASIKEVQESVELALRSLKESGKKPRDNKFYKQAEVRTRALMRRIDGLHDVVAIDEQPAVERVRARVTEIHDELILAIMGRKAK